MKVAIMQPYFFPYIGYWQLINAVDKFVVYDDVNYQKGGWISRNNILVNRKSKYLILDLNKASQNKLINEINICCEEKCNDKLIDQITTSYLKAPYFDERMYLIDNIINNSEKNLAGYLAHSIIRICDFLGIKTQIIMSSDIKKNDGLHGQEKIISICKELGANVYINAIGGKELYSKEDFKTNEIRLKFLRSKDVRYQQFNNEFVPYLSIIDVLMFNSLDEIRQLLGNYELM